MENEETLDSTGDVEPTTRKLDTNKRRIERLEKQVLILAHFLQQCMDWIHEQENKKSGLILPS